MKSLKMFAEFGNHMCIGNNHILINFGMENLMFMRQLKPKSLKKVHIFITDPSCINTSLKDFIYKFGGGDKNSKFISKIIFHIPKKLNGISNIINSKIGDIGQYKIFTEKSGVKFSMDPDSKFELSLKYNQKCIDVNIVYGPDGYAFNNTENNNTWVFIQNMSIVKLKSSMFKYPNPDSRDDITDEMKLNPEEFKDILLAKFKESCPPKILETFKSDDDIWNYIIKECQWKSE